MSASMEEEQQALEQFTLLAKSMKGRAVVGIIQQALSSKRVFVFGELLAMPNVQALRNTEHAAHLSLLELFAYGTYSQYDSSVLPELNDQQTLKLRQLSIVTMAREKNKVVSYDDLSQELGLSDVRALEDVIIETIYAGLVSGKMDQKAKLFRVSRAAARDVAVEDVPAMAAKLKRWAQTADLLVAALDRNRQLGEDARREKKERDERLEDAVDKLQKSINKDDMDNRLYAGGGGTVESMDIDRPKRRAGKRSRIPLSRGRD